MIGRWEAARWQLCVGCDWVGAAHVVPEASVKLLSMSATPPPIARKSADASEVVTSPRGRKLEEQWSLEEVQAMSKRKLVMLLRSRGVPESEEESEEAVPARGEESQEAVKTRLYHPPRCV